MGGHFIQTVTTTLELKRNAQNASEMLSTSGPICQDDYKYSFGDPCDGPNSDRLSVHACNTTEKVAKMSVFSLPVNNLTKLFGSNVLRTTMF